MENSEEEEEKEKKGWMIAAATTHPVAHLLIPDPIVSKKLELRARRHPLYRE
jgi:hypothetical protein